jgi:hypothetical protein
MKTTWILTTSYNDHNQYGDYFVAAFEQFPTDQQLKNCGICPEHIAELVLNKQTPESFCTFELREVFLQ